MATKGKVMNLRMVILVIWAGTVFLGKCYAMSPADCVAKGGQVIEGIRALGQPEAWMCQSTTPEGQMKREDCVGSGEGNCFERPRAVFVPNMVFRPLPPGSVPRFTRLTGSAVWSPRTISVPESLIKPKP